MNLRIIQPCIFNGEHVEAGTVLKNAPHPHATDLIISGRAVIEAKPETIETRDPQPEHRDPRPVRKQRAPRPTE